MSNRTTETVLDGRCKCAACVSRTEETYELPYACINCEWTGTATFRKGDKARDMSCPHCGCWNTARRVWPQWEKRS